MAKAGSGFSVDAISPSVATAAAQPLNMIATHQTKSISPIGCRNVLSWSLVKKRPDARRAMNSRAQAYSGSTLERVIRAQRNRWAFFNRVLKLFISLSSLYLHAQVPLWFRFDCR